MPLQWMLPRSAAAGAAVDAARDGARFRTDEAARVDGTSARAAGYDGAGDEAED